MLEAYIDDSASDSSEEKRLFLAGYIQSQDAWKDFTREWTAQLAAHPAIRSLHMATSFTGWAAEAREAKIDALVSVLNKYKPLSIECSISRSAYGLLTAQTPYDLRHPYFPCFVGILYGVMRTAVEDKLDGPVHLVFDEQGSIGADAAAWYTAMKHNDPALTPYLGGQPRFASDDSVVALQAADMLAWYVRRASESRCSKRQRDVANAIRFRHRYMEIPDHMVAEWGRAFERMPNIRDTQGKRGSTRKFMEQLSRTIPPERVVPALKNLHKRLVWLLWVRSLLRALGLEAVWKRISKRKITIR